MDKHEHLLHEIEALRAEVEALRKDRNLLHTILDSTIDFIYVKDTESRFILSNAAHLASMGKSRLDDVLGKTDLDLFPPEMGRAFYEDEQRLLRTGEPLVGKEEHSLNRLGKPMWGQTTKVPLRDDHGDIIGLVGITRDISERKRAEEERERLITELDAFAHTVAHDLKNPLSAISGGLEELIDDHGDMLGDAQVVIEMLLHGAHNMNNIIEELLLLADVRKSKQVPVKLLDMTSIVQAAIQRLSYLIERYRAHIVLPAEPWPAAMGYAPWIEEVWANYLSNAIKYGGSPPVIHLGATEQPGAVRFWIRDNGEGICERDQGRLFTQFTRLDDTRAQGHGLGLSIAQRIINRLGGHVGVESAPGKGSTFFFTLSTAAQTP